MATAKINCPTVDIGTAPYITITDITNADNWTLTWEFYSYSGTIAKRTTKRIFSDYVWDTDFYNELPSSTEGTGVLILDLYLGNTFVSTVTTQFKVTVNKTLNAPTIALPTFMEYNDKAAELTGDSTKFIRYISNPHYTVRAAAKNGATLVGCIVMNGGSSALNGGVWDWGFDGYLPNIASQVTEIRVQDSRALVTAINYYIPDDKWIPYIKLTCHASGEITDTDGNMVLKCSGNYYNGSFGATSNELRVYYRYKENGGTFTAWQSMPATINGNTYEAEVTFVELNYEKSYVFECKAVDKAMEIISEELPAQALPVFHWGQEDFTFEVPVKFNKGIDGIESGSWTPTLTTAAAVSSYSTRSGWYMRVGNVVTVGFNINALCKVGYGSTAIGISGLPFTPAANAFGGGVLYGAYVIADFCFEAWAATTSGEITPRLQPCNNTAAKNFEISSTAYYPSGASSITLGGTITYLTK